MGERLPSYGVGRYKDDHLEKFCQSIMLHSQNSSKAGVLFAEIVGARVFTSFIDVKQVKTR